MALNFDSFGALLGKLKEHIAAVGAAAAAVAAIFTTMNSCSIEGMKRDIQVIDLRERGQRVTKDLTDTFFDKFMCHAEVKGKEKEMQALLALLDLNAQASADDGGWSEADARKIMPLNMALLFGKPGTVAALDAHYKYIERWVGAAVCDDDPRTSVTAIKALRGLCMRALREKKLLVAVQCSTAIDDLVNSIGGAPPIDDPVFPSWLDAIAVRSQLVQGIKSRNDELSQLAASPGGLADTMAAKWWGGSLPNEKQTPAACVARLREYAALHEGDMQVVLEAKERLVKQRNTPGNPEKPPAEAVAETKALASACAAVSAAAQGAVVAAVQAAGPVTAANAGETPVPLSNEARDQAVQTAVAAAIADLGKPDASAQAKARTELVLFGQLAISPIVEKISQLLDRTPPSATDNAYLGNLALALKSMQQPIRLSAAEVDTLAKLLNVKGTRTATTEFFMDLWDQGSIRLVYAVLEENVRKTFESKKNNPADADVALARRSALIVGTWARNLVPSITSISGSPMRNDCLAKAKDWVKNPGNIDDRWKPLLSDQKELIRYAEDLRANENKRDTEAVAVKTAVAVIPPPAPSSVTAQLISIPVQPAAPLAPPAPAAP